MRLPAAPWSAEVREGFRQICTREFWRAFRDYWSSEAVSARIDDWTHRYREEKGQSPDPKVEARRRKRAR
jgi:hypothetical protein